MGAGPSGGWNPSNLEVSGGPEETRASSRGGFRQLYHTSSHPSIALGEDVC